MLCIQDPTYSNSMLLHEALLNAAENALYGAGVYAFASADGAMLLLEDATFSEFLHRGRFSLIVGIDEITTPKALAIIEKKSLDSNHHLSAAAFVHSSSNSTLFHPKFSWFKYENGGSLIIGSGNLTQGGLRRNYEAFAWMQLSETEIISIETEWNLWQKENTAKTIMSMTCRMYRKRICSRKSLILTRFRRLRSTSASYPCACPKRFGLPTRPSAMVNSPAHRLRRSRFCACLT